MKTPSGTANPQQTIERSAMATRKVVITGAGGLLATPTLSVFQAAEDMDAMGLSRSELDITDAAKLRECFSSLRPDVVINCAAYTRVDDCETNEAYAYRVNGDGAGNVARAAADCGAGLIHISTDYVFDGHATTPYAEDHPTGDPARLSAYGRSKLSGEKQVRQYHLDATIVRTAWLYGHEGPCFPKAILGRARTGEALRVVNDQIGAPTFASDLAEALLNLARCQGHGIFHVTNAGRCSWHEFACEIIRRSNLDVPIEPVATSAFPRPAKRPMFSVLDNRRYIELTGRAVRSWPAALADYLSR